MRKLTPMQLHKRQQKANKLTKLSVYLICENIRSLRNVGAIFRTADGAGVIKIFLTGYTGTPPRPEISKTALGAEDSVPWEAVKDPAKAIIKLHREGIPVYALEQTKQSTIIWDNIIQLPVGLVIGNETEGISTQLLAMVDGAIEIPMYGIKESLNVAVSCGVALYEIARQNRI